MKINEITKLAISKLSEKFEQPVVEAEWIVALALNIRKSMVYDMRELSQSEEQTIFDAVNKRLKNIPIAYIFGSANFYGLDFQVNENVLIPRPETEELVEEFLKNKLTENSTVLDIGTGSGAIAVTIAKKSLAKVTSVDISEKALNVAKINAKNNNAQVEFVLSDVFENLMDRKFDFIISNPPYISMSEYENLDIDVKAYEPKLALVADDDGLYFYKKIISEAPKHLKPGGKIYFEIGYLQAKSVAMMLQTNFIDINIKKDLQGQERIVFATLK